MKNESGRDEKSDNRNTSSTLLVFLSLAIGALSVLGVAYYFSRERPDIGANLLQDPLDGMLQEGDSAFDQSHFAEALSKYARVQELASHSTNRRDLEATARLRANITRLAIKVREGRNRSSRTR